MRNMAIKLAFLLFSLQLWHFGMSSGIPQVFAKTNELDSCVSSCNSFPIRIGSKLYHIESTLKANWFQAANNCRKMGGYLLNVESSFEMDLIVAISPSAPYWISSNCLGEETYFISLTTGWPMPYSRWMAGQPYDKQDIEDCVQIVDGVLKATNCESLMHYICQANIL